MNNVYSIHTGKISSIKNSNRDCYTEWLTFQHDLDITRLAVKHMTAIVDTPEGFDDQRAIDLFEQINLIGVTTAIVALLSVGGMYVWNKTLIADSIKHEIERRMK